jgi:hypothetical protein
MPETRVSADGAAVTYGNRVRHAVAADIDDLVRQVKRNCNISDAKFWGYYSICGLLMRYRELYRNEHFLHPWDNIGNEQITRWIQERETLWKELEGMELRRLTIGGETYDPFDVNGVNAELCDSGLVYGSGYGAFSKPTFFVAVLDSAKDMFDYRVHYAGRELCRDIAAAPAMLQGRCIYARTEVIEQLIWDRLQEVKAHPHNVPAETMFSQYGIFRSDSASPGLYEKIRYLADEAAEVFVMHEMGEACEDVFDDDWHEMLFEGCDKATELFLRGIKDIRADTSAFGPLRAIVETGNSARLCILVTFMDGIRREIFPEIREALQRFGESGDWAMVEAARLTGYRRAGRLQAELVRIWRQHHDVTVLARHIRDEFPRPGQRKKQE